MRLILVAFIAAALAACSDGFTPNSAPQVQAQQQPVQQGVQTPQQAPVSAAPPQSGFDTTSALVGAAFGYMLSSGRQTQPQVVQAPAAVQVAPVQTRPSPWFKREVKPEQPKPVTVQPSAPKPAPAPVPPATPAPAPKPAPSFASQAYKQSSPPTVTYRSSTRK